MIKFLGDNVYHTKLDNNLNIFYIEKKGFDKKYASISTNFGSNDLYFYDKDGNKVELSHGIAHFLEHKMFEQPDGSDAFSKFAEYGASANAFTNFHITSYLFATTNDFYPSLEHLLSYVGQPHFTDENVKKEQGIIEQEIKMYDDNPDIKVHLNTLKAMYVNHPNSIDIIGSVESINKITKEELYKCYETFYAPSNLVLTIVGDLDWEKILKVVKNANLKDYMEGKAVERIEVDEPNRIRQKMIVEEMSVSIPIFSIGYKDKSNTLSTDEMLKRSIATDIIQTVIFGKGSALGEYLKENELIFEPLSFGYTTRKNYGYSLILGESREIEKVIELIKGEIKKFKEQKISISDFERVKKSSLGEIVRISDSIEGLANLFATVFFEDTTPMQLYETIKNMTLEYVNKRLDEFFDEDMSVLSLVKPIGE